MTLVKRSLTTTLLAIVGGVSLLTACTGWHLRGSMELPAFIQPLQVLPSDPYSPLQRALYQLLKTSHIVIANDPDNTSAHIAPNATLSLQGEAFTITPYTIGVDGQVKENKLTYTLTYTVTSAKGETLIPQQTISLDRTVFFNTNQILSSTNDQNAQENQLRLDALNQLLRQLAHVHHHTTP